MRPETPQPRSYERERELIEAQSLDAAVRMFLSRWTPPDDEDRPVSRDFESDFIQIVQRIYREAQAPYVRTMADVVSRQPMPAIFLGALTVDDVMVGRALRAFDTGISDPNDYRRRMRAALEAVMNVLPTKSET